MEITTVHIIHAICQTVQIAIGKPIPDPIVIGICPASFNYIINSVIVTVKVSHIRYPVVVAIADIRVDLKQADKINEITYRCITTGS